jgi:ADP-heptose:LPS heptosyltransferase
MAALLYTEGREPGPSPHVVYRNLHLLGALGVQDETPRFPLDVPRTPAVEIVEKHVDSGGYMLLNPGAAWPNKRWSADRFGALASSVRVTTGLRSVVLWGPGEEPLARAVGAASDGAAVVAPETTFIDLFALAKAARLMVSGDSGPLHVAAAAGTPVVALFGPTRLERNGPWDPADIGIARTDRCACLYERRCRKTTPCLADIGVEEVVAAVNRRLPA